MFICTGHNQAALSEESDSITEDLIVVSLKIFIVAAGLNLVDCFFTVICQLIQRSGIFDLENSGAAVVRITDHDIAAPFSVFPVRFNALDVDGIELVKEILLEEKARGALIVLSCHEKQLLESLSDELYLIQSGKITDHIVL